MAVAEVALVGKIRRGRCPAACTRAGAEAMFFLPGRGTLVTAGVGLSLPTVMRSLFPHSQFQASSKKGISRLDKQMRKFTDIRKKSRSAHAVKISIEGNKMPL